VTNGWRLKLGRAEEHLKNLEGEIAAYVHSDPYEAVRMTNCQQHSDCWRYVLRLSPPPPTPLALILGDAVHNMRSALDHLAVALAGRDDAAFPIIIPDIEHPETAIDEQARKSLEKSAANFKNLVRGMDRQAVKIIRDYQPFRSPPDVIRRTHALAVVAHVDNADKHRQLVLLANGLRGGSITRARGEVLVQATASNTMIPDGAEVAHFRWDRVPPLQDSEVQVEIHGAPTVAVDVGLDSGYMELSDLWGTLIYLRDSIVPDLEPFVKRRPGRHKTTP
jgi:hypothetical protein